MWNFSMRRSLALMVQTMPFILLRCAIYFGIALAYILFTGMGAGVGWSIGALGDDGFQTSASIWGGVAGFGITAAILYFLREYLLYMVKAGHIAVLVYLIDGQPLPEGRSQIAQAQQVVKSRYAQANVLFALDQIVKGVIVAITGLVQGVASILPIPGISQLMGLVRAFLRLAVGLVDEVILAYAIRTESQNPWSSAQTALVLYGQNGKNMLKNAAWLALFTYGLAFLVFLVMLAPAAAVVYMIPGAWSAGGFLFALVFAWAVKAALIEPFAIACMLQAYFQAIEGQEPDQEWEDRLDGVSAKFRKLKDKAADWASGRPTDDAEPARAGTGS
ncbi:hypothetical protein ACMHYO_03005 [Allopusillimonas ginsengisoli]|uniref:hypothetical protein n=1 Tax=Allopusillimonas ginsengisoli TaxID=453575 RepID=UPI0039C2A618